MGQQTNINKQAQCWHTIIGHSLSASVIMTPLTFIVINFVLIYSLILLFALLLSTTDHVNNVDDGKIYSSCSECYIWIDLTVFISFFPHKEVTLLSNHKRTCALSLSTSCLTHDQDTPCFNQNIGSTLSTKQDAIPLKSVDTP